MRSILSALFATSVFAFSSFTFQSASAQTVDILSGLLAKKNVKYSDRSFPTRNMKGFYAARDYTPIWLTAGQLNEQGLALMDEVGNSYRDGLDPSEYLAGLSGFSDIATQAEAARLELALSHTFLTLGRDLFSGVTTPSVTDPNIIIKRKKMDSAQWLEGAANTGVVSMLRTLRPSHPQYAQLRQMLGGYRSLLLRGGWQKITKGPTLKPGMTDPRVNNMRENLMARGYDLGADDPNFYDEGLVEAMKHFQMRHGLTADGVAGPNTFKAMSVSAEDRVNQLAINLERWRWLPRNLGRSHVLVNQAGFELFMVKGGKTVDNRRVIVGKPFHQSPMFSGNIAYAEFNPTWTVPLSIAGKEMLPKIRNNPAYLKDKNYLIYKGWGAKAKPINPFAVDWSAVSASKFPYRIVQQPGPRNALGQVKFIFPNKFSVYLHDTPSRNLFARSGRAFSHGCIRVEKPLEFASLIYSLQGGLNPKKIQGIIKSKKQTRIRLKNKLPVHLAYFTAWINEDGVPLFFEDVYKRDKLVSKYLF
ncbi:MAG: L,D-transpeptidase family protein [Rhizobiaceae bacterium]